MQPIRGRSFAEVFANAGCDQGNDAVAVAAAATDDDVARKERRVRFNSVTNTPLLQFTEIGGGIDEVERAVFETWWRVLARGSNGIGALEPPPQPQIRVRRCRGLTVWSGNASETRGPPVFSRCLPFRWSEFPCREPVFRDSAETKFLNHSLFHVGKMTGSVEQPDFFVASLL